MTTRAITIRYLRCDVDAEGCIATSVEHPWPTVADMRAELAEEGWRQLRTAWNRLDDACPVCALRFPDITLTRVVTR